MAFVERRMLADFLAREGAGDAVDRHLDTLEPLFAFAERGRYALPPVDLATEADAREALGLAVGVPPNAIAPVSVDGLARLPTRSARADARKRLGANLRSGVWLSLWLREADAFAASLGPERKRALERAFDDALGLPLRAAFDDAHRVPLGDDLCLHAWNTVEQSVLYHLGYALAGDPAASDRLGPLVRLLPRAIPLCRADRGGGPWLVLVG